MIENPRFALAIPIVVCHSFRYFRFGWLYGHFRCRSSSKSFWDTVFEIAMVDSIMFAVENKKPMLSQAKPRDVTINLNKQLIISRQYFT